MSRKPEPQLDDGDNPEWTEADFARARPASELPIGILEQFPRTRTPRGPQKSPKKVQIAIRLSPDIVDHYRATGRGWQGRMEAALRKDAGLKS